MSSLQLWLFLLVVVIVLLLAWLELRRRDAVLSEEPAETLASLESATPDLKAESGRQNIIDRLQHDNKVLWELLSVTLSHIRKMEREAEAKGEGEG